MESLQLKSRLKKKVRSLFSYIWILKLWDWFQFVSARSSFSFVKHQLTLLVGPEGFSPKFSVFMDNLSLVISFFHLAGPSLLRLDLSWCVEETRAADETFGPKRSRKNLFEVDSYARVRFLTWNETFRFLTAVVQYFYLDVCLELDYICFHWDAGSVGNFLPRLCKTESTQWRVWEEAAG